MLSDRLHKFCDITAYHHNQSECAEKKLDKQSNVAFVYSNWRGNGCRPFCCPHVTGQVVLHLPMGANRLCNAVIGLMKERRVCYV